MTFIKNIDPKARDLLKKLGFGLVAALIVAFSLGIVGNSVRSQFAQRGSYGMTAPSFGGGAAYAPEYSENAKMYATDSYAADTPQLSARNIAPIPPATPRPTGADAEEFEVTDYNATIETRKLADTCGDIADLKGLDYVIFENANESDRTCSYTFKVEHDRVMEVLALLEDLNPKELTENTYTIKGQIEDFTSEEEILKKKLDSINETLGSAIKAYDDVTALAVRTQNAESLAKIIDSKIGIIERLTQERLNINERLDRLSRAKAEQLDRLEYTYFNVYVYENRYIDTKNLTDSWKATVRQFVADVNTILQDVTINLIALLLFIAQWVIYLSIALVVLKYGWRAGKKFWNK